MLKYHKAVYLNNENILLSVYTIFLYLIPNSIYKQVRRWPAVILLMPF